jgi:hypothetical protein
VLNGIAEGPLLYAAGTAMMYTAEDVAETDWELTAEIDTDRFEGILDALFPLLPEDWCGARFDVVGVRIE